MKKSLGKRNTDASGIGGGSIVPNALWSPIFPVGSILTGIFMLADRTTKGLYVCKDSVFLKSVMESKERPRKKRIIGMPIAIGRGELAEKAVRYWHDEVFQKKRKDEEFVWNNEVENEFVYRGVDLYADTRPQKIKRRFINEIGHKFKDTHFVHFELNETKDYFEFTPKLYDAFTFKEVKANFLTKFKMKKEKATAKNYWKRLLRNINLFPNAVTLSYHTKPVEVREVSLDPSQTGEF